MNSITHSREVLRNKHGIVIKVGTSSLSYPNRRMNLHNIRKLAGVLCGVRKRGAEVILENLGAIVVTLVDADLFIMLSDIDGPYDAVPKTESNARIIHSVYQITTEVQQLACGAGYSFSSVAFDIIEGRELGTHFVAVDKESVNIPYENIRS
ncbi:MAG TPA: hypothetical protein PK627_14425 [Bacteroidales bacterium]|nr:hypothetical protein [Bacteroidales bacterium]